MLRRLPVASSLLVLVLGVMAVAQASDVPGFVDVLRTFDLPLDARVAAVLVIVGEAAAAAGLVIALRRPGSGLAAPAGMAGVLVGAAWTAAVLQALLRGLDVPTCGWLGVHLAHELRWWALAECGALLALAVTAWRQATRRAARARSRAA